LKKIKDNSLRLKVANSLESIIKTESLDQVKQVKKLKGEESFYRIKIGDYRLGFVLEEETIIVLRFLHRKDIYKYFPK